MADRLAELGIPRDRILVVQDGYDPEEFMQRVSRADVRKELNLPADAFVALYGGSFYPWKGVDLAVQAWEKTPEQWHLVLVGGPEGDRARLEALIAPPVRSRVHILPMRPRADLVRLYPAADVALLTSSPNHTIAKQYTSPLKQFEYLAAGLPVVASDVPSSHEVLTDTTARFFKPSVDGFLSTMRAVAEDPAWRERASVTGPQCVLPFSWERRARSIADWMKTVVSAYHPSNV
jgi:glycosyltransferase involved in cell wall biosynthesis